MKTNLLALVITILTASSSIAQEAIDSNIKKHGTKFYHNIDSVTFNQNINIISILPAKSDTAFPFRSHLSARLLNKREEVVMEQADAHSYHFNMPVAKPKANSKILIAKFDPNFPYSYNMPVLKTGEALKE